MKVVVKILARPDSFTPLSYARQYGIRSSTRQIPRKNLLLRKGKPKEIWGRKATGQASTSIVLLTSRPGCRSDQARPFPSGCLPA